ncbi:type II 3-dehydroquinate dehydratase [Fictibacillus sp. Mic-4]|uniref:type II 3-dehydroquinate dehydratase n=1 Tax=Fictibacillus TaxID=1329200 RepID=UPI0004225EA0|nr:type II 3-dehydroquinate dehydratase [Fictibacillus gelatini]
MNRILVLNGPNLNLLGKREPDQYGFDTLETLEKRIIDYGKSKECEVECRQSNHEGNLIDWIHGSMGEYIGIVLNAGAFTHYSYAIRDAIASVNTPVVEVHISNVHKREPFRHESVIAPVVIGQIVGFGLKGYELAIDALLAQK